MYFTTPRVVTGHIDVTSFLFKCKMFTMYQKTSYTLYIFHNHHDHRHFDGSSFDKPQRGFNQSFNYVNRDYCNLNWSLTNKRKINI